MLIPCRCTNCGKLLGDKYDYYVKRLRELKGVTALEPLCFDGSKVIKTKEAALFEELQIIRYCCRKVLLTHVDLIEKV